MSPNREAFGVRRELLTQIDLHRGTGFGGSGVVGGQFVRFEGRVGRRRRATASPSSSADDDIAGFMLKGMGFAGQPVHPYLGAYKKIDRGGAGADASTVGCSAYENIQSSVYAWCVGGRWCFGSDLGGVGTEGAAAMTCEGRSSSMSSGEVLFDASSSWMVRVGASTRRQWRRRRAAPPRAPP